VKGKLSRRQGLQFAENNAPRAQLDSEWEKSVKMSLIARDLMVGNPKLAEMGFGEEAHGHNAIASGFQGQRQWTDYQPNGDFLEAILNTSFDWNGIRAPYIVATENDCLNGASMLFGHLLTNTAQIFADVRTYWSADSVKRVPATTRRRGGERHFASHQFRPGHARRHGQQEIDGQPALKPFWEITKDEAKKCLARRRGIRASRNIFPAAAGPRVFSRAAECR
jgi:L-fucose isomerase